MFIQKTLAAGVVALTALATTAPAQADSFSFGIHGPNGGVIFQSGDGYRPVRRSLRQRGFHDIRFTDRHGRIYRARATGPRGARVALTIRSRDARIVEIRRIRRRY
jgi:hypothetical protein